MSRFFIVLAAGLAACSTAAPPITTSVTAPIATTTTTMPPTSTEAPQATTAATTSTFPTTTIAADPDTATQNQLVKVLTAAASFYDSLNRYPTINELLELGQPVSDVLGEPGSPFVISSDSTLLIVGSSLSGRGFCVLAEDTNILFGMGTVPVGVDTVRECRGVGSPAPWQLN